ncbi:unnamed protein product [Acanthoscelides obtectus]|nr:unnamed protein product [Acanthoscelides obtectus]CAK1628277.1 RalA-binding protein 1 [Acanthoscelides obtectus]
MSKQNLAAALNHIFHISSRLLQALLHHSQALFPSVIIFKYIPPLGSGSQLPDKQQAMEIELKKQESLLAQIHKEMNICSISKEREELLWEVQRIITQLKRKLKMVQKVKDTPEKAEEAPATKEEDQSPDVKNDDIIDGSSSQNDNGEISVSHSDNSSSKSQPKIATVDTESHHMDLSSLSREAQDMNSSEEEFPLEKNDFLFDDDIVLLTYKRNGLMNLKEQLLKDMQAERNEIEALKAKLEKSNNPSVPITLIPRQECLDDIMVLLQKENQILQIKKINLVRKIIEEKESCIELSAQLRLAANDNYSNKF